jgi:hypothetical protein
MENEPIYLQLENGEVEATPDNTSIFTFIGKTALQEDLSKYDHVFFAEEDETDQDGPSAGEDERRVRVAYIFRGHPVFEELMGLLLERNYPAHLNMREVSSYDRKAFKQHIKYRAKAEAEDLPDYLPDDWEGAA